MEKKNHSSFAAEKMSSFSLRHISSKISLCHLVISESYDNNALQWLGSSPDTLWLTDIFGKTNIIKLNWKNDTWCPICKTSCISVLFENVIDWYELCGILPILPQTLLTLKSSRYLIFLNNIFRRIMKDEYSCQMQCKLVTCWHFMLSVEKCVQIHFIFSRG